MTLYILDKLLEEIVKWDIRRRPDTYKATVSECYPDRYRDDLTYLYNMKLFRIKIVDYFNQAKRRGSPLSALVLDLKDFKNFNDTHGQRCGDIALAATGMSILKSLRRGIDSGYRISGGSDEFVILLPDTDMQGANNFQIYFSLNFNSHRTRYASIIEKTTNGHDKAFFERRNKLAKKAKIKQIDFESYLEKKNNFINDLKCLDFRTKILVYEPNEDEKYTYKNLINEIKAFLDKEIIKGNNY